MADKAVQYFKGDAIEKKMHSVMSPIFDLADIALDEFYEQGFDTAAFLLMLYDEKRFPFRRVNRDSFVPFIREALNRFPFIGSFESYIFILVNIFGPLTEVTFDVPDPGKLSIEVVAVVELTFDFIAREFVDDAYVYYDIVDYDENILAFRGVAGIQTEYELSQLFAEIMPAGIVPDITLLFYSYYEFIDDDGDTLIDDDYETIIFDEGGE